jgi:hypothetical protein
MAGVYPPSTDGNVSTTDEDCLAKTLLDRLNIPASPVVHDEREKEEDEEVVVIPASVGELKQKGVEESCEEEKEVVAECDQEPLWV